MNFDPVEVAAVDGGFQFCEDIPYCPARGHWGDPSDHVVLWACWIPLGKYPGLAPVNNMRVPATSHWSSYIASGRFRPYPVPSGES